MPRARRSGWVRSKASVRPWSAGPGAALVLLALSRVIRLLKDIYILPIERVLPKRLAFTVASVLALWSFWAAGNGLLQNILLRSLESAYREIDVLRSANEPAPRDPLMAGSPTSLISWDSLGAEGRGRILSGPPVQDISALAGGEAITPLRAYVGLNSAETPPRRARVGPIPLGDGGIEQGYWP